MPNFKLPQWLIAVLGIVLLAIAAASFLHLRQRAAAEEYRVFTSPDGRFQIVVYKMRMLVGMPGQSGDAPGLARLIDTKSRRTLQERRVEMVQLIGADEIHWSSTNVEIKLLADWALPR